MSTLVQEIESKIKGLQSGAAHTNTGRVREVGDGIARVEGLSNVMLNEMVEFPGGVFGLALNLEENEVGVVLLGNYGNIKEGDEVTAVIVNVDRKTRNIQLSIKAKDNADQQEAMQRLSQSNERETAGTTSLGALLRAKLDNQGN